MFKGYKFILSFENFFILIDEVNVFVEKYYFMNLSQNKNEKTFYEASKWYKDATNKLKILTLKNYWHNFSLRLQHYHLSNTISLLENEYSNFLFLRKEWIRLYYFVLYQNQKQSQTHLSSRKSKNDFSCAQKRSHNIQNFVESFSYKRKCWINLVQNLIRQTRYNIFLAAHSRLEDLRIKTYSKTALTQTLFISEESHHQNLQKSNVYSFEILDHSSNSLSEMFKSDSLTQFRLKKLMSSYLLKMKQKQCRRFFDLYIQKNQRKTLLQRWYRFSSKVMRFYNASFMIHKSQIFHQAKQNWNTLFFHSLSFFYKHQIAIEQSKYNKENLERESLQKVKWKRLVDSLKSHLLYKGINEIEARHKEKQIEKASTSVLSLILKPIGTKDSLLNFVITNNIVPKNLYTRPLYPKNILKEISDISFALSRKILIKSSILATKVLTTEASPLATAFANAQYIYYFLNKSIPKDNTFNISKSLNSDPQHTNINISFNHEDLKRKENIENG